MLTLVATALEFHYSRFFHNMAQILFCQMRMLGLCTSSFHLSSDERNGLENFPHQICNGRREEIGIPIHRKKRFTSFPSPAGMSLTKLPLGRNNSVMTSLFPPRESLVVTSRLGTGNLRTFFYGVEEGRAAGKSPH